MKILLLLVLLGIHSASARTHSLKYFFTGSSEVSNFPQFVVVGLVDDVQILHYDSNTMRAEPKQDWMSKITDPQYWERHTGLYLDTQQRFKATIEILKPRFNQTGELPSVSLLQKSPSSPVTCHATGFYPNKAVLSWRKDGEDHHEDVDHGETLPNHDGTFQMSTDLRVSSIPPEDWRKYDCVFQLSGVEDVVKVLDKDAVQSNREKPMDTTIIIIVAVVVLIVIIFAAAAFLLYRRFSAKSAPSPASSTEVQQLNTERE
ncbi:major histocompatibility complex class I-related gene protein-like isoform X2 [Solea solea]|uniref:major histocompatibility complex class I-related gene protein-like isoform X2 n=1 Tax=Solea solea TaxID=90069 RepID=UPI00272CE440|nr:major histocompatibility complex class I-related gene protein-like isoform X2 [Solea solea]